MSKCLTDRSIDHVLLERGEVANSWKTERWDSLRLLTPNWQSRLPGFGYEGDDPDGLDLALEHNWAKGGEIENLDFGEGEFGVLFEKILLEDRNRAWAAWLDERLDSPGTVLVAVGAGHFSGPTSVQAMLAERGLSAERID